MMEKYRRYTQLRTNERENVDFKIDVRQGGSNVAIIAPHGGKIEPGTTEIATAIADDTHHFYSFVGQKSHRNSDLHMTSVNFNEPKCLRLIAECDFVVAVHGCRGSGQRVFLGGKDHALRDAIERELTLAGFKTGRHRHPGLQGTHEHNVCNKGRRRRGVQLEIQAGLRDLAVKDQRVMQRLGEAVRAALREPTG
jgi:phage replication-related protein YjqB (UPF0714/DUF867 family)